MGNKRINLAALLLASLLLAGPVWAEVMPRFPLSVLQTEVEIRSPAHRVLLSPVREINDEIRSNVIARVPVEGTGQLFEVISDSGRKEAREFYLRTLQSRNATILYQCAGVACGRSNVWANQVFNQSTLYGRDADQDYLAAAYIGEDSRTWLTLVYTVTRGNQREYVWVEHLALGEGAVVPGLDGGQHRIVGPLVISWTGGVTYRFDWTANDRRRLNDWAAEDGSKVVLASYSVLEGDESLTDAMGRARAAAESLAAVLGKTGIRREQIEIITIGPAVKLADPGRQGNRVEIVVVRR